MLTKSLVSRAILLRTLKNASDSVKQPKRNLGHGDYWSYRVPPRKPAKKAVLMAEGIGALCWWWIFYHIFTEPDHITGEWPYVDPSTWTDAELGVPPDKVGTIRM